MSDDDPKPRPPNPTRRKFLLTSGSGVAASLVAAYVPAPSQEIHSRQALDPVFADLNKYAATMHFVGQSTILTLTAHRATGETYTLAHHLTIEGAKRHLMIAALRYSDTFVKQDGAWLFAAPAVR